MRRRYSNILFLFMALLVLLVGPAVAAMADEERRAALHEWLSIRNVQGIGVSDLMEWTLVAIGLALAWIVYLRRTVKRSTAELQREVGRRREKETELEQRVEELRDAHQRLSFYVQRMPLGYIVWDGNLRALEWNPAAEKIFGWSAAEARGNHAYDLIIPPEARAVTDELWKSLMRGEEPSYSENENIRKDGRRLICEWYNAPLRDPSGNITAVLSMVHDITDRRRAEDALKTQFDQISAIFDSINAVVYVADMNCHELLYLNRYGVSLLGEDWRGKTCYEVLQAEQSSICSFCTNEQLLRDCKPQPPCVWEFQNAVSGQWFQCIDRAIHWPDGRLVRMVIAFDITERKEVERVKDEIISAVSHEMRTPLTAIMGYAEYMLEIGGDPSQQKTYLRTIYQQTEKLNELIDMFLSLQRLSARQTPFNFQSLILGQLLEEAAALFGAASPIHQFILEVPADLPPVWGDVDQLRQVLTNLVSNAVKYSPAGGEIVLGARSERDGVTFQVKDRGVGIPPAALEKIFDRFYRLDNTDRRIFGGTGLGLALVLEIVYAHGGRVWVESTLGKGSTFYVYLPARKEVADAERDK